VEPLGRSSAYLELLLQGCREHLGGVVLMLHHSAQLRPTFVQELDTELAAAFAKIHEECARLAAELEQEQSPP